MIPNPFHKPLFGSVGISGNGGVKCKDHIPEGLEIRNQNNTNKQNVENNEENDEYIIGIGDSLKKKVYCQKSR